MTKFEYINANINRIRCEIKNGMHSTALLSHWGIYSRYDLHRRLNKSICESAFLVSDEFGISEMSIFRIKKQMESEYKE